MMCPRCTTTTLDELDRSGIQIDRCGACRGIWLDRGELEKLLAASGRHDEDGGGGDRDRRDRGRDDDDDQRGGVRGFFSNLFD